MQLRLLHAYHYMTTQMFNSCCRHPQLLCQLTLAELYHTAEYYSQIQHVIDDLTPKQFGTTFCGFKIQCLCGCGKLTLLCVTQFLCKYQQSDASDMLIPSNCNSSLSSLRYRSGCVSDICSRNCTKHSRVIQFPDM